MSESDSSTFDEAAQSEESGDAKGGALYMSFSPPKSAPKKRVASMAPPARTREQAIVSRRSEMPKRTNDSQPNTTSASRIREQLLETEKQKDLLRKQVETGSLTTKVASTRALILEDKLKSITEAKSKAELRRGALEKEVTELRKRCGLLEQKIGRQGSRKGTFELQVELKNQKFVFQADKEAIEDSLNKKHSELEENEQLIKQAFIDKEDLEHRIQVLQLKFETDKFAHQQRVASLDSELELVRNRLAVEEHANQIGQSHCQQLQQQLGELTKAKFDSEKRLNEEIGELEPQLANALVQVQQLEAEIETRSYTVRKAQASIQALEKRLRECENSITTARSMLGSKELTWEKEAITLDTRCANLNVEITTYRDENSALLRDIETIQHSRGDLTTSLKETVDKLQTLENQFNEMTMVNMTLQKRAGMLQEELIKSAQQIVNENRIEASRVVATEQMVRENTLLIEEIESFKSEAELLTERFNQLNDEMVAHREEYEELVEEHAELKRLSMETTSLLVSSRGNVENLTRRIDALTDDLKITLEQLHDENCQWQITIQENQEQNLSSSENNEKLRDDIQELQREVEQYHTEFTSLGEQVLELTNHQVELDEKIAQMEIDHSEYIALTEAELHELEAATIIALDELSSELASVQAEIRSLVQRVEVKSHAIDKFNLTLRQEQENFDEKSQILKSKIADNTAYYSTKHVEYEAAAGLLRERVAMVEFGNMGAYQIIDSIESQLEETERRVDGLGLQSKKLGEHIISVNAELAEKDQAVESASRELLTTQQLAEELEDMIKAKTDENSTLEEKVLKTRNKLAVVEQDIEIEALYSLSQALEFDEQERMLEMTKGSYQHQISSAKEEKSKLSVELKENFRRLTELDQQFAIAKSEFAALRTKSAAEIDRITRSIQAKQSMADALTSEVHNQKDKNASLEVQCQTLKQTLDSVRSEEEQFRFELQRFKEESIRDRDSVFIVRGILSQKHSDNAALRQRLAQVREETDSLLDQLSKVSEEENLAQVQLACMKERQDVQLTELSQLNEYLVELRDQRDTISANLEKLEVEFDELITSYDEITVHLETAEAEAQSLKRERESLRIAVAQVHAHFTDLSSKFTELRHLHSETIDEMNQQEERSAQLHDELEKAQIELQETETALQATQADWEVTQLELASEQSKVDGVQSEINEIGKLIEDSREEANKVNEHLHEARRLLEIREQKLLEMTHDLESLAADLECTIEELDVTTGKLGTTQAEFEAARTALREGEAELTRTRTQLHELSDSLIHLNSKFLQRSDDLEQLNYKLNTLKNSVSGLNLVLQERFKIKQQLCARNNQLSAEHEELVQHVVAAEAREHESQQLLLEQEVESQLSMDLQKEIIELHKRCDSVATERDQLENRRNEIEIALRSGISEYQKSLDAIKKLTESEAALRSQLTSMLLSEKEVDQSTQVLQTDAAEVLSQWSSSKSRIRELTAVAEQFTDKTETLRQEKEALKRQYVHLQDESVALRSDADSLRLQIARLETLLECMQLKEQSFGEDFNRAQVQLDERIAAVRQEVADEINKLQGDMSNIVDPYKQEALELRNKILSTEATLLEANAEVAMYTELHRSETEQRHADSTIDIMDLRRTKAQLSHDLKITQRELDRARETLRARDSRIAELKATVHQSNIADISNEVLRESLVARDQQLRGLQEEIRQLKMQLNRHNASSLEAKQIFTGAIKAEKMVSDMELKLEIANTIAADQSTTIKNLVEQLQLSDDKENGGTKAYNRIRAENEQLKRERSSIMTHLGQFKVKSAQLQPAKMTRSDRR